MPVNIIQHKELKGSASLLPDSGSVADILPSSLARRLDLEQHRIDESTHDLEAANGMPVKIHSETSVTIKHNDTKLEGFCLVSDDLKTNDIIIS